MLIDLQIHDARPVVLTGAQRSADGPASDGARNLQAAISVATSIACRDQGALVCFGGFIHAARGTRKTHNSSLEAFHDADRGPIGVVLDDRSVRIHTKVSSHFITPLQPLNGVRVDTIAIYPGADRVPMDACVSAGARGLVLQATGCGNAPIDIANAARDHIQAGVTIVLSSRVQAGAIRGVYGGGGGGMDLLSAGSISAGRLRPSQARILLAALLASNATPEQIGDAFAYEPPRYVDRPDAELHIYADH